MTAGGRVVRDGGGRSVLTGGKAAAFDASGECSDCCGCPPELSLTVSGLNAGICAGCVIASGFGWGSIAASPDGVRTVPESGPGSCGYWLAEASGLSYEFNCTPAGSRTVALYYVISIGVGAEADRIAQVTIFDGNLLHLFDYNSATLPGVPKYLGDSIPNELAACGNVPLSTKIALAIGGSVVVDRV